MSLNVSSVSGGLIHNYPEKVTYKKEALEGLKDILHIDGLVFLEWGILNGANYLRY